MWGIDLTGHTALVTGGARGIGAACCRALAQAGAAVAINHSGSERGRRAVEELCAGLSAAGAGVMAVGADVADPEQVEALFRRVEDALGPPDLLVGSAGTTSRAGITELEPEEWRRVLDVNLTGAYLVVHRAVPAMLRAGRGSIVLIGSQVSLIGGGGGAHYAASKAGLEGLVRQLSRELLPQGIRTNAVLPSAIDTELFRERYPEAADREAVAAQIPARRLGTPEDIADAVLFLLSDRAGYICGHSLLVDGGRTYYR